MKSKNSEAMPSDKFDKYREPLTLTEWALLVEDRKYARVGYLEIGDFRFSTVWIGLDHRFGKDGPPLIFESMAFYKGSDTHKGNTGTDIYQVRYSTLTGARFGHLAMLWKAGWTYLLRGKEGMKNL